MNANFVHDSSKAPKRGAVTNVSAWHVVLEYNQEKGEVGRRWGEALKLTTRGGGREPFQGAGEQEKAKMR